MGGGCTQPEGPCCTCVLASHTFIALLVPAQQEPPSSSPPNYWDVNALTETLVTVGATVTEGITSLATNITGWVADLASAFDSSWGDDEGQE